jgi:hypothetical protein
MGFRRPGSHQEAAATYIYLSLQLYHSPRYNVQRDTPQITGRGSPSEDAAYHFTSAKLNMWCSTLECLQLVLNDVIRREFAWYPLLRAVSTCLEAISTLEMAF